MKLTKPEIQFIENYLIKNEVKFWDVRLELLDHIVSAVEEKTEKQGISFNEALLEVHCSFGNKFIEFGTLKRDIFKEGLYQNNIGFKKFVRKTQKLITKKNRASYWQTFKKLVRSTKFIVEYFAFILISYTCFQYKPKTALMFTLLALGFLELYKFKYVFKKGVRYSMTANVASSLSTSFLCLQGLFLNFYKDLFTVNGITNHSYIICFYVLAYPFMRASLNLYIKTLKKVTERYNLMVA